MAKLTPFSTTTHWLLHHGGTIIVMCLEDAALFNSRGLSHGGINVLRSVKEMLLLDIKLN